MSELTQVSHTEDTSTQRTHVGSSHDKHTASAPSWVGSSEHTHGSAPASPTHQSSTIIQKNTTPTQHAKSTQQLDISRGDSDTETETQDRPSTPKSPSDGQLIKVIKDPIQPEIEQFQDRSPIQLPIEYTQSKDTLKNLNSKRQLPDSYTIPTELDSKKVKKNELLMNEVNHANAQKMLSKLLKDPWAPPFEVPVDPDSLNLPDYFEIIKRPMDLGTIANTLNDKKYPTVSSFTDDVKLVFSNAMLYNAVRSDIHKAARNFLQDFDEMIRNTPWDQAYDTKIPEVTTPIIAIPTRNLVTKPTPTNTPRAEVTHIEEPRGHAIVSGSPPSPPLPSKFERTRGSHPRGNGSKHGGYNCLVYYQNETIPYDFEWQQLHSREEFEQKLRSALNITSISELEIGIKRSKPNFGREVFVQLSPRWEEFPRVACILVKLKKQ